MDFALVPIILIIVFVLVRLSREVTKFEQARPGSGRPLPPHSKDVEGARDLSDFLESLRQQNEASSPDEDYEETLELRQRVREAARRNREKQARGAGDAPPVMPETKPLPVVVAMPRDVYHTAAASAYADRVSSDAGGLDHPLFSEGAQSSLSMVQRAVVLREVLGLPVGLR